MLFLDLLRFRHPKHYSFVVPSCFFLEKLQNFPSFLVCFILSFSWLMLLIDISPKAFLVCVLFATVFFLHNTNLEHFSSWFYLDSFIFIFKLSLWLLKKKGLHCWVWSVKMCTEQGDSIVKKALKSLCCENGWSYGVLWSFDQTNSL